MTEPNEMPVPRAWQAQATAEYQAALARDFLAAVWVACGKTAWACMVTRWLLMEGRVKRVVVVVPSANLQRQWRDTLTTYGIPVMANWENALLNEAADYQGLVTTYQSVAANPDVYRVQCARADTLVIGDELHHAADVASRPWGPALRRAFEQRRHGLYLSATPFRSDGYPLPFITYDEQGVCVPDFQFGYADALRARVNRMVTFPRYEGTLRWLDPKGVREARFADPVPSEDERRRLATALDLQGQWLPAVLAEADAALTRLRATVQADAGGLVVARDILHARGIANLLRTITGEEAVVITSDDEDASGLLEQFKSGTLRARRWLVSVRMVSEGVDIPRLYVGVYATDILNSALFFAQVVGRLLRITARVAWNKQIASLFIPAIPRLVAYAREIMEQRNAAMPPAPEWPEAADPEKTPGGGETAGPGMATFIPLSSEADPDGVMYAGAYYPPALVERAVSLCLAKGWDDPSQRIVVLATLASVLSNDEASPINAPATEPLEVRKSALRSRNSRLVDALLAVLMRVLGVEEKEARRTLYRQVQRCLGELVGARVPDATLEQLLERERQLISLRQAALAAAREGKGEQWATEFLQRSA